MLRKGLMGEATEYFLNAGMRNILLDGEVYQVPNMDWTKLSALQVGRYAEYFAKMEFASYGLEVYTTEVDDHGVDFIVKDKQGRFCEIQVKSVRGMGYIFTSKSKFDISNQNLYLTVLVFENGKLPHIFLIG